MRKSNIATTNSDHARAVWPSGPTNWLKAPVREGVGSNPTAVTRRRSATFRPVHRRAAISWWRPAAPTRNACKGGRGDSTNRTDQIRGSIAVIISARHAEDQGSIPGRGVSLHICKKAARKSPFHWGLKPRPSVCKIDAPALSYKGAVLTIASRLPQSELPRKDFIHTPERRN